MYSNLEWKQQAGSNVRRERAQHGSTIDEGRRRHDKTKETNSMRELSIFCWWFLLDYSIESSMNRVNEFPRSEKKRLALDLLTSCATISLDVIMIREKAKERHGFVGRVWWWLEGGSIANSKNVKHTKCFFIEWKLRCWKESQVWAVLRGPLSFEYELIWLALFSIINSHNLYLFFSFTLCFTVMHTTCGTIETTRGSLSCCLSCISHREQRAALIPHESLHQWCRAEENWTCCGNVRGRTQKVGIQWLGEWNNCCFLSYIEFHSDAKVAWATSGVSRL